jgi:hypothetical protein
VKKNMTKAIFVILHLLAMMAIMAGLNYFQMRAMQKAAHPAPHHTTITTITAS